MTVQAVVRASTIQMRHSQSKTLYEGADETRNLKSWSAKRRLLYRRTA